MSSEDIDKGARWGLEIGEKLDKFSQGIICVTPDNYEEPWLNFEAGALAKSLQESRVRPVLFGLEPHTIVGPLAQFQATVATDREDMLRLLDSLNQVCERPLGEQRLKRSFEIRWDDFLKNLEAVRTATGSGSVERRRSQGDMLGEVLERVRELQRSLEQGRLEPVSQNLVSSEVVLSDGSPVKRGTRVQHDVYGSGRVSAVASTLAGEPLIVLEFTNGGHRAVGPHELRADVDFSRAARRYEEEVYRALRRVDVTVGRLSDDSSANFIALVSDDRTVMVSVKHSTLRTFSKERIDELIRRINASSGNDESESGTLVVTNVPLSPEVQEVNAVPIGSDRRVEVVTWRSRQDDEVLYRALLRLMAES
jgi:hypothetical protein